MRKQKGQKFKSLFLKILNAFILKVDNICIFPIILQVNELLNMHFNSIILSKTFFKEVQGIN